jgi:hypothetical protein
MQQNLRFLTMPTAPWVFSYILGFFIYEPMCNKFCEFQTMPTTPLGLFNIRADVQQNLRPQTTVDGDGIRACSLLGWESMLA